MFWHVVAIRTRFCLFASLENIGEEMPYLYSFNLPNNSSPDFHILGQTQFVSESVFSGICTWIFAQLKVM